MRQLSVVLSIVLAAGSAAADQVPAEAPPAPAEAAPREAPPEAPPPEAPPQPRRAPEAPPAAADAEMGAGRASVGSGDYRRQGSDDQVARRRELELGVELAFPLSQDENQGVPELTYTDVGLLRLSFAGTPIPRLRVAVGTTLLPKQPAELDEPVWQASSLALTFNTSKRTALRLGFGVGALLGDAGYHGSAGAAFVKRKRMNEFVSWEGHVGVSATNLWYEADVADPFWFAEVGVGGQVQVCYGPCKYRYGAVWMGVGFAAPVYHNPDGPDPRTMIELDPRTRLDFTIGQFVNISKTWDMYTTLGWVDRGDTPVPATQLPILDGGFDQVQISFGVLAHWSFDACGPDDRDPDCKRKRYEDDDRGYE